MARSLNREAALIDEEISGRIGEWLQWAAENHPMVNFATGVQFDLYTVYAQTIEFTDGSTRSGFDSWDWLQIAEKFEEDVYDERFGWFYHDAVPDTIDLVELRRKEEP